MTFCTACGHRLEPDARFCIGCGTQLQMTPSAGPETEVPAIAGATRTCGGTTKRMKIALWGAGLALLVAGGGALYATPYLALHGYKSAFERRALSELAQAVDVPALAASLKQLSTSAMSRSRAEAREAGVAEPSQSLGFLGALAGDRAEKIVDSMLTEAFKPVALKQIELALATGKGPFDGMSEKARGEAESMFRRFQGETVVSTGYVDINTFRVRLRHAALGEAAVLLRRQGLTGWQIAGFEGEYFAVWALRRMGMAPRETVLAEAALKRMNYEAAQRWYEAAAFVDEAGARHRAAMLLLANTRDGATSAARAIRLLEEGAGRGDASSAAVLGRVREFGVNGEGKDPLKAVAAYEVAFKAGERRLAGKLYRLNYALGASDPERLKHAGSWLEAFARDMPAGRRAHADQVLRHAMELQREPLKMQKRALKPSWLDAVPRLVNGTNWTLSMVSAEVGEPDRKDMVRDDREHWTYINGSPYFAMSLFFTLQVNAGGETDGQLSGLNVSGYNLSEFEALKPMTALPEEASGTPAIDVRRSDWCPWSAEDLRNPQVLTQPGASGGRSLINRTRTLFVERCDASGDVVSLSHSR